MRVKHISDMFFGVSTVDFEQGNDNWNQLATIMTKISLIQQKQKGKLTKLHE